MQPLHATTNTMPHPLDNDQKLVEAGRNPIKVSQWMLYMRSSTPAVAVTDLLFLLQVGKDILEVCGPECDCCRHEAPQHCLQPAQVPPNQGLKLL